MESTKSAASHHGVPCLKQDAWGGAAKNMHSLCGIVHADVALFELWRLSEHLGVQIQARRKAQRPISGFLRASFACEPWGSVESAVICTSILQCLRNFVAIVCNYTLQLFGNCVESCLTSVIHYQSAFQLFCTSGRRCNSRLQSNEQSSHSPTSLSTNIPINSFIHLSSHNRPSIQPNSLPTITVCDVCVAPETDLQCISSSHFYR